MDGDFPLRASPFIQVQRAPLVVPRDQLWGKDLTRRFPRIVRVWVPFPLDQILELTFSPEVAVVYDSLHLELLFSCD